MTDDLRALIRSYAERLTNLLREKADVAESIKDLLAEVEEKGLGKKTLQKAVKEYEGGWEAKAERQRLEQYILALEDQPRSSAKRLNPDGTHEGVGVMKVGAGVEASA